MHLDVKPDNIVMGIPPRLIDLSIARSLERARARCAARSAPTPTCRPSSALPARRARSGPGRTSGGSAPRSTTRSPGDAPVPAAERDADDLDDACAGPLPAARGAAASAGRPPCAELAEPVDGRCWRKDPGATGPRAAELALVAGAARGGAAAQAACSGAGDRL